jgi:hypothetical protein
MSVGSVSPYSALQNAQQTQQPAPQKQSPSQPGTDSVQLSPAALSHLKGGDVDGDGDGH